MECNNNHKPTEMYIDEAITDYHDPADRHGHGQYTTRIWVCPVCGEQEECYD